MKKYFLIIAIFMLPVIYEAMRSGDMVYSGMTYPTDGNTYMSFVNQARDGNFLFTNMYTSEYVPRIMFRPTYLFTGILSFVMPDIIAYHLMRILGIVLLVFFLDRLYRLLLPRKLVKWTIFFAIAGSGFGYIWYMLTGKVSSPDIWLAETNMTAMLLSHPHNILSIAFMCGAAYYFLQWFHDNKLVDITKSSILLSLLGFEHLFDVITLCSAFGILVLEEALRKKRIRWELGIMGALVALPLIYTFVVFTAFPEFAAWDSQNNLTTPRIYHVFLGYGLLFFSFAMFLKSFWNKKLKSGVKLMLYWTIATFVLIYAPLNIQRRFLEGLTIPLAVFTSICLFTLLPKIVKDKRLYLAGTVTFILLLLPTSIYHYQNSFSLGNDERKTEIYFVPKYLYHGEIEAFRFLQTTKSDSVILSTYNIGNYIPRYANRYSYLGHWAQTISFDSKQDDVRMFYRNKKELSGIDYIWYGVDERKLYPKFVPPQNTEKVFDNILVQVYKAG
ncbi:MAG: hypothetical protein HGA85_03320 [Nanoarchaeota archaeon]|nr:hypothetical protein [Nanoarchaeota archaeon]